jgi:outer membrane protein assembly factor BamB
LLFAVLAAYEWYRATHLRVVTDPDLLDELRSATILEDEPPATEAGWPQWLGLHRDGVAHDPQLALEWPARGPVQLWQASAPGYSSCAVAGGRAYTLLRDGDQEVIVCWAADTGKELWRKGYPCDFSGDFQDGPHATPVLDGERLYTVGVRGRLVCWDRNTGAEKWHHDLQSEFAAPKLHWGVSFSPLVEGDLLITQPGAPNGKSFAAFDKKDGKLLWNALDDPAGYSSPIAVTAGGVRQIVCFTAHSLVGLSREGRLLWRFPWPTPYGVNAATPLAIHARQGDQLLDHVFISSGYDAGCALLKLAADGAGGFTAKPVYTSNEMCNHFSTSVRYRDHLYGIDEKRDLTCLDLRTGEVRWRQRGFYRGSLLRVDDKLIVLAQLGKLALIEATPEGYHELASARPTHNQCWNMPVLAEGRLYLHDVEQVFCLDLRK